MTLTGNKKGQETTPAPNPKLTNYEKNLKLNLNTCKQSRLFEIEVINYTEIENT